MDRREYCSRVLGCLGRVTEEEREAIRRELDGHIEDHMEGLTKLGYAPDLAEERTLAAMGDPAEVGRELGKQYPFSWLILGRLAALMTVLLGIMALLGLGVLSNFFQSMEARTFPDGIRAGLAAPSAERPDIRVRVGNDVLRIYRVSAAGDSQETRTVEIHVCAYDQIPGGVVSQQLLPSVVFEDPRGALLQRSGGGGKGSWRADFSSWSVTVQPGDAYVTLRYERFGERIAVRIPLPGEVIS